MDRHCWTCPSGTTLIEVVVAIGLTALLLAAVAPVTARTILVVERSRLVTIAHTAAASQLDRLRALPWYHLPGGSSVLDTWSLLRPDGFIPGGPGLTEVVGNPLDNEMVAYGDVLPPVGNAPTGAALVRRWSVTGVVAQPSCLLLVVEVATVKALVEGQLMERAALGRAQTIRCADGVRP